MNSNKRPILRVGYLQITDHLVLGVSEARDAKRFRSFELQTVRYHDWQALLDGLRQGEVDAAFIITTLAFKLLAEGISLRCLLLGHREGLGLVAEKSISKANGLRGKTIAVPHTESVHHILLKEYITAHGLTRDDVQTKEVAPPNFVQQLARGDVAAYFGSEPFGAQAEEQYVGNIISMSKAIKKNHIDCVFAVQQQWMQRHQAAIQECVESFVSAGRFIHERPHKASEIGAVFLNQSQQVIHRVIEPNKGHLRSWDLVPFADEFEEMFALGKKHQVLTFDLNSDAIQHFVDPSYAIAAYKKLAERGKKKAYSWERIKKYSYPLLSIVFLFSVWELLIHSGIVKDSFLPAPSNVWMATQEIWQSGVLVENALASLYRVFSGFLLAASIAIPVGLLLGTKKYLRYAFGPLLQMARTISPISWIPLAILWFGIGDKPAIFIIFITAFFPILLSTSLSIKHVDPILVKVAHNFGIRGFALLKKIIFPAIFPYIVIALRVTLGISWVIVVAAEMVGMSSGLGYMILDARNFLRLDLIISGMLIIGLIGFVLDLLLGYLEQKIKLHWGMNR